MQKKLFRKECLIQRKAISKKNKKSLSICDQLITLDVYKNSHTIAVYLAKEEEVNLSFFINKAFKDGKTLVIPKVIDNDIQFYIYHPGEELILSSFRVLEPKGEKQYLVNSTTIDLFIVPGVAFDENNNRMGYGKGYFDRVLKNTKGYKIGVCFKEMLFKEIPHNDNDILMDMVIHD